MRAALAFVLLAGCRANFQIHDDAATTIDDAPIDGPRIDAPGAPITFVQRVGGGCGAVSMCAVTNSTKSFAGDVLLVTVTYNNVAISVTNVTDNFGDMYTRTIGPKTWPMSPYRTEIWFATLAGGAQPVSVTVRYSGTPTSFGGINLNEYAGVNAASPVDQTASASGLTGTMTSSGSRTITHAREMIVGHGEGQGPVVMTGAGFITRDSANGNIDEDMVVSTIGSYDAHFMLSAQGEWIAMMVTLQ